MKKLFIISAILLFSTSLYDAYMTYTGIQLGKSSEGNPVMLHIYNKLGLDIMIACKILITILMISLAGIVQAKRPQSKKPVVIMFTFAFCTALAGSAWIFLL